MKLSSYILLFLLLLGGCFGPMPSGKDDDDDEELQTEILELLIDPNPVAPGDTAFIKCVIRDSLDKSFVFYWNGLNFDGATTKSDTFWVAPSAPDRYSFTIHVDNGRNLRGPQHIFYITVR